MTDGCISIIVPNYNNGRYLESCLESILAQDYENFEVILIDDSSTDESGEIIRKYADRDQRIHPLFNEKNQGVAVNRHQGILRAKGEFITTLDSDDVYLRPDKLRKEYEVMRARAAQGVTNSIVFSGIILLDAKGGRLGAQSSHIQEGDILNQIVRRACLIPRDFLFRQAQYLGAGGFDPHIPIYEDWDLKIRLAKRNYFYYSGIDGIGYRRHGTGLSAAPPIYHAWWLSRIFMKNFFLLGEERMKTVVMFGQVVGKMVKGQIRQSLKKIMSHL